MALGMKTGGRQKGTPNKNNPLKGYLRAHSIAYFEPKPQVDRDGNPRKVELRDKDGVVVSTIVLIDAAGAPLEISDFDVDIMLLDAPGRVNAELRLLEFHTPKMKAVEVDMDARLTNFSIEDRLRDLCTGSASGPDDDE